jgi:hypothetical protein
MKAPLSLSELQSVHEIEKNIAGAKGESDGKISQKDEASHSFHGANFGAGFAVTIDSGGKKRVNEASIGTDANRTVHVDRSNTAQPRIMLEAHYFFTFTHDVKGDDGKMHEQDIDWLGVGPFLGLQLSPQDSLLTYAAGGMVGFRPRTNGSQAFNIGVGAFVDPEAKFLRSDFVPGQPAPTNESDVKFTTKTRWGTVFMISFSF